MIFGGVLVGIIIMVVMIYLALNKKSDKFTRIAAIIALGIMILTVIICVIIAFSDTTVVQDPSKLIVGEPPETKETGGNAVVIIFLVLFLIAIFVLVAILAMKENRKHIGDEKSNKKTISNW